MINLQWIKKKSEFCAFLWNLFSTFFRRKVHYKDQLCIEKYCYLLHSPTPEPIIEAVPSAPVESEIQAISDEAISKTDDTDGARGEPGNIENLGG